MTDKNQTSGKGGPPNPFEGFAAASALGIAMTTQAMEMWLGVMTGLARASNDMFARNRPTVPSKPEVLSPGDKSAVGKAKSVARTVVADIERTARDVAEVTAELAVAKPAKPAQPPKPKLEKANPDVRPEIEAAAKAEAPKEPAAAGSEVMTPELASAKVVALSPKPKASKRPEKAKEPAAQSLTTVESAAPVVPTEPVAKAEVVAVESVGPAPIDLAQSSEPNKEQVSPVAKLMPEDFRSPASIEKPASPDDLKLIDGVGPKIEKVLNGLGVWTFNQIAEWQPEEIAWVDDYLGLSGRIMRDDWLGQSRTLTSGKPAN